MIKSGYVTLIVAVVAAAMVPCVLALAQDDEERDELGAAAVARFLRSNLPEHLDDLHYVLEEEGPEAYAEALNDARDLLVDYLHFRDLELGLGDVFLRSRRLDHRISEVAEWVWEAEDEPARSAARADLRAAVSEQFDLDLKLEQAEVRELERQVKKLRRELQEHNDRRDELVDEEVNDILSDDEGDDDDEDDDDDNEEDDD